MVKDFLAKYGHLQMFNLIESKSYQTELAHLDVVIHQTTTKMNERDADVDALMERLKFYKRDKMTEQDLKPKQPF